MILVTPRANAGCGLKHGYGASSTAGCCVTPRANAGCGLKQISNVCHIASTNVTPRSHAGCGNEFPHPCDHQCFARNQKGCASGYYANVSAPSFLAAGFPRPATPPPKENTKKSQSTLTFLQLIKT